MGVFDKLFGRHKQDTTQEHAVIVHFAQHAPARQASPWVLRALKA
jgi:hypothetical protein